MKAKEFDIKKRDPNWRAMQDIRRSGAGGQHKDKKRAAKQGDVKHKNRMAEDADELYGLRIGDTVTAKIDGQRVQGDIIDIFPDDMEVELLLRGPEAGRTVVVDVRDTEIVEATGDEKFDTMMRTIKKGTKKQAAADRRERDAESRRRARDAFGPSPADKLSIRSDKGVAEGNDQELTTRLKIDLGNIRNAEGETRLEFKDKIEAAGGRLKFISKGPTGPDAYELNGKEVRWQGVEPALGNFVYVPPSTQTGAPATGSSRVPKIGDRVEFGIFNKPNTMKQGTVTKTDKMKITVKTDDGKQGNISLGNKSLALKILEDDGTITQHLPFGSVRLPKPDPVSSRPGLQQRPGGEKEKESMPPKIKRLWDRIKQEPKIWAEVMNIIDEFDTLRDDEIEDEINAFLSSDTLIMRAVGIVLRYEHEKMKNESVREGIGGMIAGGVGQFIGNKIDPLAGEIMRAHGEIAGRKAEYTIRKYMHLLQKELKQQLDSGEKDESVREDSDWGEPREILEDVLRTLEREVEWPLTDVMDPKEVRQLLSPLVRAVNDKLLSMDRDGNQ